MYIVLRFWCKLVYNHLIINDGDFIVVSPSAEISSSSGLPVYEFKAYTNDRFIRLMEMNNQFKVGPM